MLVDFGIVLSENYAQRFCNAKQNARADNFFQKKAEPGTQAVNRAINLGFFFWSPARRNNIFKISGRPVQDSKRDFAISCYFRGYFDV